MVQKASSLGVADFVIFGVMLVMSLSVGIFYSVRGRLQKNKGGAAQSFLTARGQVRVLPVAISSCVSYVSAISILGEPAEMYTRGTMYYTRSPTFFIGIVIALLFVPLFHPLKLTSMNEYLELRFKSRAVRLVGSVILLISEVMYLGIAVYAPSTALEAITNIPLWVTILTMMIVATCYTTMGGMKAVIWTDVLQCSFIIAGLVAVVIQANMAVGGIGEVWHLNDQWSRIDFFNFDPDPTIRHTFWALMVGGTVDWVGRFGINQYRIQRQCALPTVRHAQWALVFIVFVSLMLFTLTSLAGISMFAFYASRDCDPISSKQISNSNQIVPYFVMDALGYPGVPGLFLACLFSAALSTVSSVLNSVATVTWQDFVKPALGSKLTESRQALVTRLLVLVYGGLGIGMAFVTQSLGGTVVQATYSFPAAASSALMGLFLLGAFFPWSNWIGAAVGGLTALAFNLWVSIGAYSVVGAPSGLAYPTQGCTPLNATTPYNATFSSMTTFSVTSMTSLPTSTPAPDPAELALRPLYSVSYLYYKPMGVLVVIIVGLIVSLISGPNRRGDVDPRFLIPVFDRVCCCLPECLRKVFRCGVDYENAQSAESKAEEMVEKFSDYHLDVNDPHSANLVSKPIESPIATENSNERYILKTNV